MTDYASYEVGGVIPGWSGPGPEKTQFQADATGLLLLHRYDNPTPREIRGARTGKARFGVIRAGRHTLFLVYDIDALTKGWADVPFALGLVPRHLRDIQERTVDQGRLLTSILIDAGTGIVHALRAISMTPTFSGALDVLLSEQRAALPEFSAAEHTREIDTAYRRWPDSRTMVDNAIVVERGGTPFR